MKKLVYITVVTLVFILFLKSVLTQLVADIYYTQSQKTLNLETAQRAITLNPNEPRYYYGRAKILLSQLPFASKDEMLDLLISAEKANPQNLVTQRNIAPFYYFLAVKDLEKTPGSENIDQDFLPTATEYFERLSASYPADAGVQVLVANYEKKLGLIDLYEDKIEKIRLLRPDLLEWAIQ